MPERQEGDRLVELEADGLFDAAWYPQRYPDVAQAGLDAALHYLRFGATEGRWPNRWFDPAWYAPQMGGSLADCLEHYVRAGDRLGLPPHPRFDPGWYRTAHGLPPDTPALRHFLASRGSAVLAPSAELFAVPFLAPYRDDPRQGIDPFAHCLDDMGEQALPDPRPVAEAGLVDPNYYLINASDVLDAGLDPVEHYCRFGWREQRRPNICFDPHWYEQTNSDLARLAINPLVHYLLLGEPLGRRPVPYFDPGWYRDTYHPPAGQSALGHFLAHRRSQAVSPTPLFDVAWYMARHGEAVGPNRDPFAHYLQAGTEQDIDPSPLFDAAAYRRRHLGRRSRGFRRLLRPEQDNPLVHHLRATYR